MNSTIKPVQVRVRVYEPIWIELKRLHNTGSKAHLRLAQHKSLHARTIKAVGKEKYHDMGFQHSLSEIDKRAELVARSTGNILELHLRIVDRPITIGDL